MSLILDALNKADRERDYRDAVPDLNTIHAVPKRNNPHRLALIVGALAAAVVLLILLVLVLWLRMPAPPAQVNPVEDPLPSAPPLESKSTAAAVAATPPAPVTAVPSATVPAPSKAVETTATMTTAEGDLNPEVRALYEVQEDPVVQQVVEPVVQPAATVVTPARQSTVDEALALTLWEESKRQQTQPVPLPPGAKIAPATAATQPEEPGPDVAVEDTLAGYAETPFLHELPVTVQNTIPTLMYAKHDFQQGLVVINKTDLHMGDATNGGVLVERVLADGVLLSLNGTEFKLSSLSSWVNY